MSKKCIAQVIDTETTIKHTDKQDKASPFSPKNWIVKYGFMDTFSGGWSIWNNDKEGNIKRNDGPGVGEYLINDVKFYIGHNFKFDLLHGARDKDSNVTVETMCEYDIMLWDTQMAEYILSGQTVHYPSLDYCAEKYGGTLKDDRLKEMWNADVQTEDIKDHIINPYLHADLKNTSLSFKHQLVRSKKEGMLPLIQSQMDGLLASTEMESNGSYIDKEKLDIMTFATHHDLEQHVINMTELVRGSLGVGYLEKNEYGKMVVPLT